MFKKCEICGKEAPSARSYAGHMWIAHQKRVGFVKEYDDHKAGCQARFDLLTQRLDGIKTPVVDGRFADLKHTHPLPSHSHPELAEIMATLKEIERRLKSHTHEVPEHKHKVGVFEDGSVVRA